MPAPVHNNANFYSFRAEFEELAMPLFDKLRKMIENVLHDSGVPVGFEFVIFSHHGICVRSLKFLLDFSTAFLLLGFGC